ncbi:hypothetical protein GCM10007392_25730 [Saccharospirillum salsuginis]|uniref:Uncharacterized protein n=1 Tax=Saccharospirillum salsuginis TaxID=418750 RepID=A0A918KBF1_9GAMM|nr:hypothetical protein GCM10007392_25730 [Saccharospirillum salsuginis]
MSVTLMGQYRPFGVGFAFGVWVGLGWVGFVGQKSVKRYLPLPDVGNGHNDRPGDLSAVFA